MKVAISLPKDLYDQAEELASRRKTSRSALYVDALRAYIEAHDDEAVTAKLDEYYGEHESKLDPAHKAMRSGSLRRLDKWK